MGTAQVSRNEIVNFTLISNENAEICEVSNYKRNIVKVEPSDLEETLSIVITTLKICQKAIPEIREIDSQAAIIDEIRNTLLNIPRCVRSQNVEHVLMLTEPFDGNTLNELCESIRSQFVYNLLTSSSKSFPGHCDLRPILNKTLKKKMSVETLVRNKLISYRKISTTKVLATKLQKNFLIENPEKTRKRTLYLSKIQQYRDIDAEFVYVDIKEIPVSKSRHSEPITVGIGVYPKHNNISIFVEKENASLNDWLHALTFLVEENCVVVLRQPEAREITPYSARKEFLKFFHTCGYFVDPNLHTAEYYNFYLKCKDKARGQGKYDSVFLDDGIPIINAPPEWSELHYFSGFWRNFEGNKSKDLQQRLAQAAGTVHDMKAHESALIAREEKMRHEDKQIEVIMDNLFEIDKNKDLGGVTRLLKKRIKAFHAYVDYVID